MHRIGTAIKRKSMKLFCFLYGLVLLGCTNSPNLSSTAQKNADGGFEFILHDGLVPANVAHLQTALDLEYSSILIGLELPETPQVTVQVWKEEDTYQQAMELFTGSRAPGSRGYVAGPNEIRLMYHTRLSAQKEAIHEFVHAATLMVNPDFGNNPRWLWEGVAQYLANETPSERTASHFQNGSCPTLEQLNSPFDQGGAIYDTGYLLGAFIEDEWGPGALIQMVRSSGDTRASLGLTPSEFERQWCDFARAYITSETTD